MLNYQRVNGFVRASQGVKDLSIFPYHSVHFWGGKKSDHPWTELHLPNWSRWSLSKGPIYCPYSEVYGLWDHREFTVLGCNPGWTLRISTEFTGTAPSSVEYIDLEVLDPHCIYTIGDENPYDVLIHHYYLTILVFSAIFHSNTQRHAQKKRPHQTQKTR